ncbi:CU044_2847 family protein [Streptomyces sp. S816]|uniref:CU044_2847 family protein n=1 Tax=Streptomyces sp. S816 TaxID=2283197 RepID=UPI001FFB6941|nr:CU044_2847 family protein [Streptomyces sp. S816]
MVRRQGVWHRKAGEDAVGEGQLVTMALDGEGKDIAVFEVDGDLTGSDLELAAGGDLVGRARVSVSEALDQVRPVLARVVETTRDLGPQEVEIQFGLKMGGETGVIIAKGTAEVNFAVRMVWRRPA